MFLFPISFRNKFALIDRGWFFFIVARCNYFRFVVIVTVCEAVYRHYHYNFENAHLKAVEIEKLHAKEGLGIKKDEAIVKTWTTLKLTRTAYTKHRSCVLGVMWQCGYSVVVAL